MTLTPQEFVAKWQNVDLKERSASQSHFNDLCALLGHPTPVEDDPTGECFTFEAGATKQTGGQGWADVWKKGCFAWEYKGKHADLDKAYNQLLQYREALENPPLLIVSDLQSILIHTNFTNTVKRVYPLTLEDLLDPAKLDILRNAFYNPKALQAPQTAEQVTQSAAAEFARLAEQLRKYGEEPEAIAHFLIRLLFCLFAEDTGLLPEDLFTKLVEHTKGNSAAFQQQLQQLFDAMRSGGWFGFTEILHFDGKLFDQAKALELDSAGMRTLAHVSHLDWSSVEPSIFGTLFERSLDPDKRSQLGAHYTSKEDILLIVEPVLMAPLRRRWADVQAEAEDLAQRMDKAKTQRTRTNRQRDITNLLMGFAREIAATQVLDPACGSGNFLYVALRLLLDLEKKVIILAGQLGAGHFFPSVSPEQLHGIEINAYAQELAQVTIWIGYIQWMRENGFGFPSEPILKPLDNIKRMDAILAFDADGRPVEPEWPEADVIIGNPPFVGGNKIRQELGDKYVDSLFSLYAARVPAAADLVCYWFEKARASIEKAITNRAGLLATNSIRGGANRKVLERIKETGNIFWAQSDRDWVLEGAAVNVSMVGFDNGSETVRVLDGRQIEEINPDLTAALNLTLARKLKENSRICFRSDEKGGPFDIDAQTAMQMLSAPLNPNGRPNSDVVRPYFNAYDVLRGARNMWVIDFGCDMPFEEAILYEAPFEYVKDVVKPVREKNRNNKEAEYWWLHRRPAPDMRQAIAGLSRFLVTPAVSKHRVFVWLNGEAIPDHQLYVFATDKDYAFGVLQSKPHELWALGQGTSLEDRPRYTPTTTFETFPFPWPPGKEPQDNPKVEAI
ncbi:MAG: class I SAM-dependent DNA methyltransferase, partial [Anaerolineae bacterium]